MPSIDFSALTAPPWLLTGAVALVVLVAGSIAHRFGRLFILRLTRSHVVAESVVRNCDRPAGFVLPLLGLQLYVPRSVNDTVAQCERWDHTTSYQG
jgi:hypothetical protein